MDLQNPILKRGMRKISLILCAWFLLEIAAFVGVVYLIGGMAAFWITLGFSVLGYFIRPTRPASMSLSTRKLASTLLIIPGFLTDILALCVLIPPVRRALTTKLLQRLVPPALFSAFTPEQARFADFARSVQNQNPYKNTHQDPIDIDYEVKKSVPQTPVVTLNTSRTLPESSQDDILDVSHEWKE